MGGQRRAGQRWPLHGAPPRGQRARRGGGGGRARHGRRRDRGRAERRHRAQRQADGARPSGPTACSWSTTPTTPTRTRPGPPSSALAHLAGGGRRGIAVLGYMAELGDIAAASHAEAGRLAAEAGAAVVVAVGAGAAPVLDGARGYEGWPGEAIAADRPAGRGRRAAEPAAPGRRGTSEGIEVRRPVGSRGRPARGGSPVKTILLSGAISMIVALLGTRPDDHRAAQAQARPADQDRRPAGPPGQERHADHGRHRHHHRLAGRLRGRAPAHRRPDDRLRACWCCS